MNRKPAKRYNAPQSFTLSRKAVEKVAAVEGIDLSGEIRKELEEFDRRSLTTEQRLAAIKRQFAKRAG